MQTLEDSVSTSATMDRLGRQLGLGHACCFFYEFWGGGRNNGGVVGDKNSCCLSVIYFSYRRSFRMGYIFRAVSI